MRDPGSSTLHDFIQLADDIATFNPAWEGIFEEASAALQNFSQGLGNVGRNVQNVHTRMDGMSKSISGTGQNVDNLHKRFDGMSKGLASAGQGVQNVHKRLDGMTASLTGVNTRLDGMSKAIRGVNTRFERMNERSSSFTANLAKIAATIYIVDRVFGALIGTVVEFEYQMARAGGISNSVGEEFQKLTSFAREMGETTIFTARESAEAMTSLARLGLTSTEIISVLPDVLNVAAAEGLNLNHAARIVGTSLNAFNIRVEHAARVTNTLAAASMSSAAEMADFSVAFRSVGAFAAQANLSIEQTVAALGKMADAGLTPYRSGNALRELIKQMQLLEKEGAEIELDRIGLTMDDINPKVQGFSASLEKLNEHLIHFGGDINKIFKTRASQAFQILMQDGVAALDAYTDSITGTNAAQNLAERQLDTLHGSLRMLASVFQEVQIAIGEDLTPIIRGFVGMLTAMLRAFASMPDFLRQVIVYLTTFAGLIAGTMKGVHGLVVAFGFLKTAAVASSASMVAALGPVGIAVAAVSAAIVALIGVMSLLAAHSDKKAREERDRLETEAKMYDQLAGKLERQIALMRSARFSPVEQGEIQQLVAGVDDLNVEFSEMGDYIRSSAENLDKLVSTLREGGASTTILDKFEKLQSFEGGQLFGLEERLNLRRYAREVYGIEIQFDGLGRAILDSTGKLEDFLLVFKNRKREAELESSRLDLGVREAAREGLIESIFSGMGASKPQVISAPGVGRAGMYEIDGRRTTDTAVYENALMEYNKALEATAESLRSMDTDKIEDYISKLSPEQQEDLMPLLEDLIAENYQIAQLNQRIARLEQPIERDDPESEGEDKELPQGFRFMLTALNTRMRTEREDAELARREGGGEWTSQDRLEWIDKEIAALKELSSHEKATSLEIENLNKQIRALRFRRLNELERVADEDERDKAKSEREAEKARREREQAEKSAEAERRRISTEEAATFSDWIGQERGMVPGLIGFPALRGAAGRFGDIESEFEGNELINQDDKQKLRDAIYDALSEVNQRIVDYLREDFKSFLDTGGTFEEGMVRYADVIGFLGEDWHQIRQEIGDYAAKLQALSEKARQSRADEIVNSLDEGLDSLTGGEVMRRYGSLLGFMERAERFGMSAEEFVRAYSEVFEAFQAYFEKNKISIEEARAYAANVILADVPRFAPDVTANVPVGLPDLTPEERERQAGLDDRYPFYMQEEDEEEDDGGGRRRRSKKPSIGVGRRTYYREMPTDFRKAVEATKRQFEGFASWLETDAGSIFSTSLNVIDRFDMTKAFNSLADGIYGLGDDFDYAKMALATFTERMHESASVTELFGSIGKKVGDDLGSMIGNIGAVLSGVPGALASGSGAGGIFATLIGGGLGGAAGLLGSGGAFSAQGAAFGAGLANTIVGAFTEREKLEDDLNDARTHDGRERPRGAQLTHQEVIVYIDRLQNDFHANVDNQMDLDRMYREFGQVMEREIKGIS